MKMVWMLFMLAVTVKAAIAVTEHPRPVFDALHESGETREVAEWARMEVAFFASALVRVRAIVWMATRIFGGRKGVAWGYSLLESGHGRSFQEGSHPTRISTLQGERRAS
ncbi:hypothetical protein HAP94_20135 [Acidithiobacillus ferrivorans]|nr:hypothetical protein [Acidithiobacillus ferrivorans]